MKLRSRIIISFSVAFVVVMGIALVGVYYLMAIDREQEFLQRLKDKTTTTYKLLLDVKEIDHDIMQALDHNTINSLYDEKILLFDSAGHNIYSSVDDTRILFPLEVISELRKGHDEVIYREDNYEVYAHVIQDKGKTFYAMGKAYDKYGRSKLAFLGWSLFFIYIFVLIVVVLISIYLSNHITRPIMRLTDEVKSRTIENLSRVNIPPTKDEISLLASGFNDMLARVEQSYTYQKNFIQHMSHELKTPIAVLISNIERTLAEEQTERWKESFEFQKNGLMQMASVVNTLLDISRYETNPDLVFSHEVRIDELIFECFDNVELAFPGSRLNLNMEESFQQAEDLTLHGNERMLNIAFYNLLKNATEYSEDQTVEINISNVEAGMKIEILNNGKTLSNEEQGRLFEHFFRGKNGRSKGGIGLGLVMARKIVELHLGTIAYTVNESGLNCMTLILPHH